MNCYHFKEAKIGAAESFQVKVTQHMMDGFLQITNDTSPIHIDKAYAQKRGHKDRVVYGMLSASMFSTLAGVYLPGISCFLHSVESSFLKPVYIGDILTISGTIVDSDERFQQITIKASIVNQRNEKVVRGIIKAGIVEE